MDGRRNDLFDLMQQIVAAESGEITIDIPEENFNFLMLKILREKARRNNRTVHFKATGPHSRRLISLLENGRRPEGGALPGGRFLESKNAAPAPRGKLRKLGLIFLLVVGALMLLGATAFAAIYYLTRAEVILTLSPIPLVKEVPLKADTSVKAVDGAGGVVPGTLQEVEEIGTKTIDATGTAIVGEKAKGNVVKFINCDVSASVTFTGGTKIQAVGTSFVYTLDAAVADVPARVGAACGEKNGSVTAEKIGSSYNLSEATNFDFVSGYSNTNYDAEAAAGAVSGGSSQEVAVASAVDHSKLLEDLQKELIDKAKETIRSRSGIDEVVVESALKTEVLEKNYSQAVGEQTEQVSLTLKVKLTTITYKGVDIQEFISQALSTLIPAEFTLFPGKTEVEALNPKLKEGELIFTAKISAQVIPKIDEQKIREDLAGRNPGSAQEYLSALSDITSFELKLWPNLPPSLQRVPRNIERITVSLKTEEQ